MSRLTRFQSIWRENYLTGQALFPHLDKWGKKQAGRIVLDVGAGESPFRYWFSDAKRYIRVDRSPVDHEVIKAEATDLPMDDGSVDCVLLFQMLSDVPEPCDILDEAFRVLRPGGVVLVFETMSYPEHDLPHDYYRILPEGLNHLAKKSGLTCTTCIRLGGLFSRFAQCWNGFVLARLLPVPIVGLFARLAIAITNLFVLLLDKIMPAPRFGTDYWAVLNKPLANSD